MIMEPFEAFRLYQSMKLHFTTDSYDAIKYNYKTSAKPQTFWKRRDKYFFAKIGKQFDSGKDLINFYAANFVADKTYIADMIVDDTVYAQWNKKNQSLGYTFEQDLYKLAEESAFDALFECNDGQHPRIVTSWIRGDINIETIAILQQLTGFMSRADKHITETIVWPDVSRKIRKYTPFVHMDLPKAKNIVLKVFTF
jgi:hypothetical protein